MTATADIGRRRKLESIIRVARYRPGLTTGIIFAGAFAALLEGIGLSFIIPIVEIVQTPGNPAENADGIMGLFVSLYQYLGVPFSLATVVVGVSIVLTIRWTATFFVRWFRGALVINYVRYIQKEAFANALDARVEFFDREGSDDILNAIVTQGVNAGDTIKYLINFIEQGLLAVMYFLVALYLAPLLTVFATVILGGLTLLIRHQVESGYALGDDVADANEQVQQVAQAGTQGIRDVKLFGLKPELFDDFLDAVNLFADSKTNLVRNQQMIQNFYNLLTAISVFAMIYLAIAVLDMPLSQLGVFLFAMFRLGPKVSNINSHYYSIEHNLPHLVRTQEFIDELVRSKEPDADSEPAPDEVTTLVFDDVHFTYESKDEKALSGISLEFDKGEFIGIIGTSGAGKSTIISMLTRMYEPTSGEIRANGRRIHEMDLDQWRERIGVVRQDPYIFNDTLRYNLTIGNRNISQERLDEIVEITKVDEFLEHLPDGYETELGDDGVKLSGGQRQRVALARAIVKQPDILILDEATSDLDSNLEKEVQRSIEQIESEYAMVAIAHRLSTIVNADQIYTLLDGYIVEKGTHDELLDNGGQYAELYQMQVQGARE